MKAFLKWTLLAIPFLVFTVTIRLLIDGDDFEQKRIGITLFILLIGSLILGLFFYFLEKHYIPTVKDN